jgi:hypothetical protein
MPICTLAILTKASLVKKKAMAKHMAAMPWRLITACDKGAGWVGKWGPSQGKG